MNVSTMRQSLVISIFSFILAFCIAMLYWILRAGFLDNSVFIPLRVLGISAFILLLPVGFSYFAKFFSDGIRKVFFNDTIVPIYGVILIGCIGYFTPILHVNLSILFVAAGYIFVLIAVYRFAKGIQIWNKLIFVGIAAFFAIWVASACWFMVLKPYILEGWAFGTDKIDTLFHISIAQMIKTYGVPSTGLDGVPFMNYHWGSHWIFAQLSNFLDLPVVVIYQLGFPAIIAPLLFRTFLSFTIQVKQQYKPENEGSKLNFFFWIIFLAIIIGFTKSAAAGNDWAAYFTGGSSLTLLMLWSESYTVSIILMFALLSAVLNFWIQKDKLPVASQSIFLFFLLPILIALLGMAKISTLFVVCCLMGYFFLRLKLFKSILLSAGMFVAALTSLAVFKVVFEPGENHGGFELFSFYTNFQINIPLFILLFYIWTFIFIGVYFFKERLGDAHFTKIFFTNKSIPIECVLVASVAGFIPTMILRIQNYDSLYFTEIQMWISSALLLVYVPFYRYNYNYSSRKWVLVTIPCLALVTIFYINTRVFAMTVLGESINTHKYLFYGEKKFGKLRFRHVLREVYALKGRLSNNNKVLTFLLKLKELDTLPLEEKRETLVYVDFRTLMKRIDYDWGLYCHNIPFIVPSLSGMAMVDGIDITYFDCVGGSCCENIGLGYHYYPKWKTKEQIDKPFSVDDFGERVRKLGFKNLIFYNMQTELFEIAPL
ncbi:MAG TPA: hypothetical protein VFG46_29245 [Chryseolinea sp.]|nr:hypothetical protein [Chryseolinea sp.]